MRLALETSRAVNQLCGQPAVRSTACRELLIFDLELGVPATSKALAAKHSPFVALLGAYGEGVTAGTGDEGGIDFIYCAHQVRAPTITSCPLLPTIAGCCLLLPAAALHCLLLPLCYPSATLCCNCTLLFPSVRDLAPPPAALGRHRRTAACPPGCGPRGSCASQWVPWHAWCRPRCGAHTCHRCAAGR